MHSSGRGGAGNIHTGSTLKPEALDEEERRLHVHHDGMSMSVPSLSLLLSFTDTYLFIVTPRAEAGPQTLLLPTGRTLSTSRTTWANSSRLDVAAQAIFVPVRVLVTPAPEPLQRRNMASQRYSTRSLTTTRTLTLRLLHPRAKAGFLTSLIKLNRPEHTRKTF